MAAGYCKVTEKKGFDNRSGKEESGCQTLKCYVQEQTLTDLLSSFCNSTFKVPSGTQAASVPTVDCLG